MSWQVGRRVVTNVAGSGYRTIVWFTPPTEGALRLAHAFARHFADGAQRALIIGTDAPGIDRRLVMEAFTALGAAHLVLGPTTKGRV